MAFSFMLNEAVLFPNGVSLPVLTLFISWLNLDLGFQTCFLNEHGYSLYFHSTFGCFIVAIIIGCRYSVRLSRFCAVPVLATLLLMHVLLKITTHYH